MVNMFRRLSFSALNRARLREESGLVKNPLNRVPAPLVHRKSEMVQQATVLVVDDDQAMNGTLAKLLSTAGHNVVTANSGYAALAVMQQNCLDLVIADLKMNGMNGQELQSEIMRRSPDVPVVIITAFGTIESAVQSMRNGAFDFITKPFTNGQLNFVVERALEYGQLRREVQRLRGELARIYGVEKIITACAQMDALLDMVHRIADSTTGVLLTGESGTGKDLLARALHFQSARAEAPFVQINCAAIPDSLLESELFGHVKGCFTGASQNKLGLFQAAHRGTLFLDEIGEMSRGLQAKLLTAIETKRVRPLGATAEVAVDARVVSATNADLEKAITQGAFRSDLYYRLSAVTLHIPPLRERREAIPVFVKHFLTRAAAENGQPPPEIAPDAFERLLQYPWPGNVRELQNAIQRAVLLCRNHRICPSDLPAKIGGLELADFAAAQAFVRRPTLEQLEDDYIHFVLASVGGNRSEAAGILGIDRKTLYRKLEASGHSFGSVPRCLEPVGSLRASDMLSMKNPLGHESG
jgi:DNA-binding NtrC family response regulator